MDDDGYNDEIEMKAISVKNQMILYESLLNLRMKIQKLLTLSNRLPLDLSILNDEQNQEMKNQSMKGIQKLQNLFIEIEDLICHYGDDDPSFDRKKRKASDQMQFEQILSKRFCTLKEYYPTIIDEWHDKTKFVHTNVNLKKFNSFDIRPSKIIDKILMDKDRLINRTKIQRSQYQIIGDEIDDDDDDGGGGQRRQDIFDDDDFYQSLLRQIIDNKTSNASSQDGSSSSSLNKIIEIQRLRSKSKKSIDTKASKGRKIRYDVHEKLVNFMAPIDRTTMEDEAKNDLFKSVFVNSVI
ncbi:hypothetical protein DERF_003895 [Dermatophagoides farinae]|uniref:Protein AATF-like n=1 Tax=Dermatophagoides farinae TaxID=6954 RepID=A0A922IFS2_DERFA|nr:hypothetical protein DERF_003895 [Dermatophagoides farinae]